MNPRRHEDQTAYLVAALGAHVKIRFTQMLAPIGLEPPHYGVLRRLARHEGCTQQEVADAMRLRRSVMVGLVDELEANGWVERRRHPADRRANALHLTAVGRRTLHRCEREADRIDEELLSALPAGERCAFREHLRQLATATGVADGVYPTFPDDPLGTTTVSA